MIWLVNQVRKSFVWVYQNYLVNLVRLKDIQLIVLMNMVFKSINVDTMVVKIQTTLDLKKDHIKVDIIKKVIQMKLRLNHLQVYGNLEISL